MNTKNSYSVVKRVILGLFVMGVIAAGGTWYVMAGKVVNGAQALIEKVNTTPHEDGSSVKITYDGLSRTMFPNIGVRLTNPAVELKSPGIAVPQGADASPPPAAPQPFHVTWKHTGTVDIITDRFTHEYRLVNDGSGTGTLETDGATASISSAPAHSEASLRAKTLAAFTQWQTLDLGNADAVKQALTEIGGVHINAGAIKVTDTTSGAVILTQDESKLDFTNRSDEKQINFDASFVGKGSQVTKEYTDLITRVVTMMHLPATGFDGSMPMSASRAGKQDVDIAMNVNLPTTPAGQPMPTGDIHVTKFSIRNNFYTLNAPLDVVMHEDASRRHATIKLDWSLDITAAGAAETQVMLDQALKMAPGAPQMNQEQLKAAVLAALPNVSTLGPITFVLDVDASVPKPGAQPAASASEDSKESLSLRQFRFGHKRWGLEAKGEAFSDNATRGGTITGTLTCKQCTVLTQDLFATAHGVQEVMALMQPGSAPFPLTDAMLAQLNATLASIGKPGATAGDIDFVVTTPAAGDVRVNDKPFAQVMPQLMMVFMPPQPPQAAPAPARPQAAPGSI
jgi:hypothetical protein